MASPEFKDLQPLPDLLIAHIRAAIFLAKIKELDLGTKAEFPEPELSRKIEEIELHVSKDDKNKKLQKRLDFLKKQRGDDKLKVRDVVEELNLQLLFSPNPSIKLSLDAWDRYFCGSLKESPINTIYQFRNLYSLEAPNNLVQRLENIVRETNYNEYDKDKDRTGKYDGYIEQWGDYAYRFVEANGGLSKFLASRSLADLDDVWIGKKDWEKKSDHYDSFVTRILHLERDRYVQVLTSTVGILWPLWFLKNHDHIQDLEKISQFEKDNKGFRLGKALPESRLFIDINTHVGQMEGLPYPFGIADQMLSDENYEGYGGDKHKYGDPWPSWAQELVAHGLVKLFWMPPLLLGVRGGQFTNHTDYKVNCIIPFVTISKNCDIFAKFYLHKDAENKDLKDIIFGCELGTLGHTVTYAPLKKAKKLKHECVSLSRIAMASDFIEEESNEGKPDLYTSYFPLDLMIQKNKNYKKLSYFDIYEKYKEDAHYFYRNFPDCILYGGSFFARQPKSVELIIDLAIYLRKVEAIFHNLIPGDEDVNSELDNLNADSSKARDPTRSKKAAAKMISKLCENTARQKELITKEVLVENSEKIKASRSGQGKIIKANLIEEWFKHIGYDMSEILFNSTEPEIIKKRKAFDEEFSNWGWAILLEFVRYTSIYISCDLF